MKHDPFHQVLEAAYRILKARQRSVAELEERLLKKAFEPAMVQDVLADLRRRKYLNDESLVRELADKYRAAGESNAKITQRLAARGIAESVILKTLSSSVGNVQLSETDRAWASLQKQARAVKKLPAAVRLRRLAGHLARQGYEPDVIDEVMERYGAQSNFDEEVA